MLSSGVAYGGQCNWIHDVVMSQYDFILTFDADIHKFAIFFMDTIACACEG